MKFHQDALYTARVFGVHPIAKVMDMFEIDPDRKLKGWKGVGCCALHFETGCDLLREVLFG
jgi:hypothetical protein